MTNMLEGIQLVVRYIDEKPINWNFTTIYAPYLVVETRDFVGEDRNRCVSTFNVLD